MAKTSRPVDLDAIDRLEEKVKLLVNAIGQLRSEQVRLREENKRLSEQLETAEARLAEAEGTAVEYTVLKEERETIRSRVADMLEQIEALAL